MPSLSVSVDLHSHQVIFFLVDILHFDVAYVQLLLLEQVEDAVVHVIVDVAYGLDLAFAFELALPHTDLVSVFVDQTVLLEKLTDVLEVAEVHLGKSKREPFLLCPIKLKSLRHKLVKQVRV